MRLYSSGSIFLLRLISMRDVLTISLLWLSIGVVLALLSRNLVKSGLFLWWWLIISLILSFRSSDLFFFYIYFELRLIPILLIILLSGNQPERLSAGSYLLFYTTLISVPYLVLIFFINITNIVINLQGLTWRLRGFTLVLLIPFLIKIPLFGVHFWLPKAHVEARTRGSMVLAGILLKLGRYGASRIICLFKARVSCSWVSRIWILLSLLSRILTFIQRDLKKMVAYRRVTHITFILVGIFSRVKLIIIRVVIVSLSHGWAAIGIFSRAGTLRHSSSSRLGTLLGSESSLFWVIILIALLLVSNSGIPPIPSFFPEVFIVIRCINSGGYSILFFILISLIVCYYNSYIFLWISHVKPISNVRSGFSFVETLILLMLVIVGVESLFWIQMF